MGDCTWQINPRAQTAIVYSVNNPSHRHRKQKSAILITPVHLLSSPIPFSLSIHVNRHTEPTVNKYLMNSTQKSSIPCTHFVYQCKIEKSVKVKPSTYFLHSSKTRNTTKMYTSL